APLRLAGKLLLAALTLLAGCRPAAPAPRAEPVPGEALADYLPADSAGVVQLGVARLDRAPVFRKLPGARPLQLLHPLQGPLGLRRAAQDPGHPGRAPARGARRR